MTTQKLFKRRVRERMAKTGEQYAAARSHVARQRDRLDAEPPPDLSSALELASDAKIQEATGQPWLFWIRILDEWGARSRNHREIAAYLAQEHGVPGWYTQAITNGYERVRGLRIKHQQADGFTVYASKTFGVSVAALFEAFTDEAIRRAWLVDGTMANRSSQPGKVARFDWSGGSSRVMVTFEAKGPAKATAHVAHERLPDVKAAEAAKPAWRARLGALKAWLDSSQPGA